ncbi:MAG: hypothetical protein KDH09_10800, partial [Chrysiogenetes bacterium]|nr:hypothetical protein [Chrysiogenetes bacterium]
LPFAGNLTIGLIEDPESCAQPLSGACSPRVLLDPPSRTLMTYDPSTVLADALLADLQYLIPPAVDSFGAGYTCPPTLPPMAGGTPAPPPYITITYPSITSFADRPYGRLCDPLVSDDLNRDGRVGTSAGQNLCGTGASMAPCDPRAGNGVHSTADFFNELDNDPDGVGSPADIGIGRQGDIGFVMMDDVVTIGGVDGLDEAFLDGVADLLAADDPAYVVDHENEGPAPLRNRFTVRSPGAGISPEVVDLLTALGELFFETQF